MGRFKRNSKIYKLTFDTDDELHGLEVQIKSLPVGEFVAVTSLAETANASAEASTRLLHTLGDALVEWNLDDEDGTPVPAAYWACVVSGKPEVYAKGDDTRTSSSAVDAIAAAPAPTGRCEAHQDNAEPCRFDGLLGQELDFVMRIFREWMTAMGSVPAPLESSSASTGTSPVPLPPMDVSSLPQAS